MNKIKILFSDEAPFVLEDKEQGVLRKRIDKNGKQIPLDAIETSFVMGKIVEGLLIKVLKEKIKKPKNVSVESVLNKKVKSKRGKRCKN